jgi:hypothetical protein
MLLAVYSFTAYSQQKTSSRTTTRKKTTTITRRPVTPPTKADMAPRQSITDKYLNGPTRSSTSSTTTSSQSNNNSPFVGGIHPADNAAIKTFDSVQLANPNAVDNTNATNIVAAGGKDTAFNVNTINQGNITTNSGAVDRSGQSQFGQTNWGNSRSTVGESQWTVPPPINNATWSRSNTDTSMYSARYQTGTSWVVTNYNNAGQRLDTRTEIALVQPPRPVSFFLTKQPSDFQPLNVYFIQMQGKQDMYQITTRGGKTFYINNNGVEISQ